MATVPRIDLVSEMENRTNPDVYLMNGFNLAVSDATPSNREIPDNRQPEYVILYLSISCLNERV